MDGPPFAPDIEAIERSGQRQRRRGLAARGLAGVAVLGVAVVGGLAADNHSGTRGQRRRPGATKTATSKAAAKTGGPGQGRDGRLRGEADRGGGLGPEQLPGRVAGRIRPASAPRPPRSPSGPTRAPATPCCLQGSGASRMTYWEHDYFDSDRVLHSDQTQVNYGPRTWWNYDMHGDGPIQGPVPSGPVGGDYPSPGAGQPVARAGRRQDRGPSLRRRAPHHRAIHLRRHGQDVRDLRGCPHLPGGPHDQLLRSACRTPRPSRPTTVGTEDPGHGEARQPPRDPGRLHPGRPSATSVAPARAHRRGARERRPRRSPPGSFGRA